MPFDGPNALPVCHTGLECKVEDTIFYNIRGTMGDSMTGMA